MTSKKLPPVVYTEDEVVRLLQACGKGWTGRRNRALLVVLYRSGLRISEALALRPIDFTVREVGGVAVGELRVQHGKGDKHRVVAIDNGALKQLQRWMQKRVARVDLSTAPIFCTLDGGKVDPSYIRHLLPRLAKKAGIAKRVHAHGFRHSAAFELAQEGVPIHQIKTVLGHASLRTTDIYLDHVGANGSLDVAAGRKPFEG